MFFSCFFGPCGAALAQGPTGVIGRPAAGNGIMGLFAGLNREEGTTLIVITHDPDIAGLMCDWPSRRCGSRRQGARKGARRSGRPLYWLLRLGPLFSVTSSLFISSPKIGMVSS